MKVSSANPGLEAHVHVPQQHENSGSFEPLGSQVHPCP